MPNLTLKSLPFVSVFTSAFSPGPCCPQLDPEVVLTPTAQRPLSSAAISSTARYVGINLASLARVAGSERVHRKGGVERIPNTPAHEGRVTPACTLHLTTTKMVSTFPKIPYPVSCGKQPQCLLTPLGRKGRGGG